MKKYLLFICICIILTGCGKKEEKDATQPEGLVYDIDKKQTAEEEINNSNSFQEGVLTVIKENDKTREILFGFDKEKYEYDTVKILDMTGNVDESTYTLKSLNGYLIDNAFAIFEKDGIEYYALEYISSNIPDTNNEFLIVKKDIFDEITENWDNTYVSETSNIYNVQFNGIWYEDIEADSPIDAAKTMVKKSLEQDENTDIYEYTSYLVNKYGLDISKLGDKITIKVKPCYEDEATIKVQKSIKESSKDDCTFFFYKEILVQD